MAGHRKFQSLRDKLIPAQRERSKARVSELQKEMLLSELRAAAGQTQQELADDLDFSQPCLSKMEKQSDMQIGALDRIVTSLGGSLEVIAHMPTGDVILTQFTQQSS
ncbi:MAG TPA: helix-turn-helix transcriptional regulator [Lacipirellulaceae bacterium]|nr:helix-turn-helix transcriptional regulator [Lacipirellulaceae bacterium]